MKLPVLERHGIVDKAHKKLSIKKQCQLLSINRSGLYNESKWETEVNLELMRLNDEHFMEHSYMVAPSLTIWLNMDKGYKINKNELKDYKNY